MTTKLEQVAEAICWAQVAAEEWEILGPWEMIREEIKAKYRAMARAAIEAMKGPTPEMVEAGQEKYRLTYDGGLDSEDMADCFNAMLSASLPTTGETK